MEFLGGRVNGRADRRYETKCENSDYLIGHSLVGQKSLFTQVNLKIQATIPYLQFYKWRFMTFLLFFKIKIAQYFSKMRTDVCKKKHDEKLAN